LNLGKWKKILCPKLGSNEVLINESLPLDYAQHSCLNHLGIYYVAKRMGIDYNQIKQAISVATDIGASCITNFFCIQYLQNQENRGSSMHCNPAPLLNANEQRLSNIC